MGTLFGTKAFQLFQLFCKMSGMHAIMDFLINFAHRLTSVLILVARNCTIKLIQQISGTFKPVMPSAQCKQLLLRHSYFDLPLPSNCTAFCNSSDYVMMRKMRPFILVSRTLLTLQSLPKEWRIACASYDPRVRTSFCWDVTLKGRTMDLLVPRHLTQ